MIRGRQGTGTGRGWRWRLTPMLALLLGFVLAAPVSAQFFSDRPPPVPPANVPEPPAGPAMNLAPTGPASIPSLPSPLTQPPAVTAVPPVVAPTGAAAPNQAVLALTARFGKD